MYDYIRKLIIDKLEGTPEEKEAGEKELDILARYGLIELYKTEGGIVASPKRIIDKADLTNYAYARLCVANRLIDDFLTSGKIEDMEKFRILYGYIKHIERILGKEAKIEFRIVGNIVVYEGYK